MLNGLIPPYYLVLSCFIDIYEAVNANLNNDTRQRNIAVSDNQSMTRASNLEMQVCEAYEVEKRIVRMKPNSAYCTSAPTNAIEMQSCDAYEVEKNSVTMETNVAYVAH